MDVVAGAVMDIPTVEAPIPQKDVLDILYPDLTRMKLAGGVRGPSRK